MNRKFRRLILLTILFHFQLNCKNRPATSFEENGVYGFKDKNGKVVIAPQYLNATDFDENGVAFVAGEKGWSCINSDNKILLNSFIFDNGPDYLSEGLARFVENKKIGFHDPGCKKTIQAEYDFAYPFENGFSIVCNGCRSVKTDEHSMIQGGNYGIINKKGEVVVPIEYDAVSLDENKVAHTIKGTLKKEIPVQ